MMQARKAAEQAAYNSAAARTVGEQLQTLDAGLIRAVDDKLASRYGDINSRAPADVPLSPSLKQIAADAMDHINMTTNSPPTGTKELLKRILAADENVTQKQLQIWASDAATYKNKLFSDGSNELGGKINAVQAAINDTRYAMNPPADRVLKAETDKLNAARHMLDAMRQRGAIDAVGDVKIGSIDSSVRQNPLFRNEQIPSELTDLAKHAAMFKPIKSSMTGENSQALAGSMLNPLTHLRSVIGNTYMSTPVQNYLKYGNPLMPRMAIENLLPGMPRAGGLLGVAGTQSVLN
jgi:hypothetical protein